jgi:hypothetical protein
MGISYNTSIAMDGLISFIDAANPRSYSGSGNTSYDISGFGGTYSLTSITLNSANYGSFSFNGTTSFAQISYPSQIDTGSPITLSMWAKWLTTGTTTATIQTLVDNNYQTSPGSIGFFIQDRPDLGGVLEWGAQPGNGITRCTSASVVGDNNWHQITATNDGSISILYVDGVQSGLARTAAGVGTKQSFITLGKWDFSEIRFLNGNIADFKIYNRALTSAEVKQNYNATKKRFGL